MREDEIEKLRAQLPASLLRRISRLATKTGTTSVGLLRDAIEWWEHLSDKENVHAEHAETTLADPRKQQIYKEFVKALNWRSAKKIDPLVLKARAEAGGAGRAAKLTSAQRSAQASNAAKKRWERKTDEPNE